MEYVIRHIRQDEWPLLEDFLYEAIFVPEDFEGEVPRSIVRNDPKCRAAYLGFGSLPDDRAVVAEIGGKVVGACWVRTTDEYGHIDNETPALSISLFAPYRYQGIGTVMIHTMLEELCNGYSRVSLSVQKKNPALHLYEREGFRIIGDGFDQTEWLMVCQLSALSESVLEFRKLEKPSIPAFVELRISQLLEEGAQEICDLRPALYDYYARHLTDGSFISWLAVHDGEIVGTSGLSIVEKPPYFGCPTGKIALISSMYVTDGYRRKGIARDLLLRVVDEARVRGCSVAQITASDMGRHLYSSCGFVSNDNFMQLSL